MSSKTTSRIGSDITKLKANPRWAKLPLFDRKGWTTLPFDAFAESIGERVEPANATEEIYVGLDDLDSGDLHIKRWGKGSDVIGTKLRFRKGDVIFGRRRAYQRKLAVAEFDGICSAHAMVVRAKSELVLPEFLPFLMMSDRFMKRAVEISVGSLSPTINWKTLKLQQFTLPPLDQQRRLAEILWSAQEVTEVYTNALQACDKWNDTFVDQCCLDEVFPRVKLGEVISAIIAGKSVVGVNEAVNGGQFGVLKISAVGPNGFDAAEHKRLIRRDDFLPRFAITEGDFLITRCNTKELVGRVCIVPENHPTLMLCDKTIKLVFNAAKVFPGYVEAILKSRTLRIQIEASATGTGGAMKNISQDNIRSLVIPLPKLEKQRTLLEQIEQNSLLRKALKTALSAGTSAQVTMMNAVF